MPNPTDRPRANRTGPPSAAATPARLAVNVFTYGSLMYPQVWDRVVRGRYRSAAATLAGFSRRALIDASYPAAVPDPGGRISGRIYFDVDADDLARLDAFEADEYRRDEVEVEVEAEAEAEAGTGTGVGTPPRAREATRPARAQLYVYLVASRLAPNDWDAARFEREHLADFARRHGAGGGARG